MIKAAHLLADADPAGGQGRGADWTGAATAAAFAAALTSGMLDLPLPGSGRTRERWEALADLAGEDLSLARLAEGRAHALVILAELGADPAAPVSPRAGTEGHVASAGRCWPPPDVTSGSHAPSSRPRQITRHGYALTGCYGVPS
jgi:hypothetical protein